MARRSFSLMLAWRYLNPRRALLSAVALISVIGVMLGVLALVVVMSVYSGMEREVKGRLLGFIPHVRLDLVPYGVERVPIANWQEVATEIAALPDVAEAGAFVQDSMLIDIHGLRSAGSFRGIDTADPEAVRGIAGMLDLENHPDSSADMGLDDRVVISSKVARSFGAGVGDTIRLLTLRNFEEVERVYELARRPPVREEYAGQLKEVREAARAALERPGEPLMLSKDAYNALYVPLLEIYDGAVREAEEEIVLRAGQVLDAAVEDDPADAEQLSVPRADLERFLEVVGELDATDVKEMNADALMGVEQIVLPAEAEIVGVYQASQMALTPDVFVPLHMAQDLVGLEGRVQAIAVRVDDPYRAGLVAQELRDRLPAEWQPVTWMQEIADFSRLIEQQRKMMYFAMSFIILVSAFSMTAVMFTITIQKRREIGVMKALGAARGQIVMVFVNQGLILGALGALTGVGLGLLVIAVREQILGLLRGVFGFDPFPAAFTGFSVLPAHVEPWEVTVIGILAFVLCAVAALVPAWFAARSDAAKSLRNL